MAHRLTERWTLTASLALGSFVCCAVAMADDKQPGADYLARIKPVLRERCYACHGVLKQEGGLRLDTATFAIKGGESGAAIKPGDVAASLIIERVSAAEESERMPPEGEPLKPAEIDALRAWISTGAIIPADEQPERDPREHWAFKNPVRPTIPIVANVAWAQNPIDAFIAAEYQKRNLTPQAPADKRLWLRRVSLDLIGLPPTSAEQAAFLADDSADAYEKVANRLLESPQYGERWGRHWMDIWRYSDWWGLGVEVRNSQKHIWHWRDWIIESLNEDKGYDQMLREMLAADELYPNDPDKLRGGGFLARQYFKFNRTTWLDGTVEHTGKAMLGLTFNCAKCHDHKYDPFSQVEYYQLRAIFEPYQVRTDVVGSELDFEKDGLPRPFDCNLEEATFLHIRGDDRNPDKGKTIEPKIPNFLSTVPFDVQPVQLPLEAYRPGLLTRVIEAHRLTAEQAVAKAREAVEPAKAKLAAATDADKPVAQLEVTIAERALATAESQLLSIQARTVADQAKFAQPPAGDAAALAATAALTEKTVAVNKAEEEVARAELVLLRAADNKKDVPKAALGKAKTALEAAQKGLAKPGEAYTSLIGSLKTFENNLEKEDSRRKPFPATSTGRRTALAKWITANEHPLTARVAVNHLWNRHFGRALVPTVFDFGRKGTPPTHPELLDWLTVELREHNWSMKHIHRLIVTSQTYRLSSSTAGATAATLAADGDNRYYWHGNPVRMQAQLIRDSLLHFAGELDLTRGGPSIPVKDETSRRRSLYFVHSHNDHQQFLSIFDDANVLECYRRSESIVPQQALALENSPLATNVAQKIAARLEMDRPKASDEEFTRAAFITILAVEPNADELALVASALDQFKELARSQQKPTPDLVARTAIIHALLNHNDFVTIR
ncbi:Planctomycete cytochrome C [Anatilimnocola aggregata]|uniref:Planctomycete cytochrome C n=1 Tax=Anatilimnocola aggregata TaxID=2528021 RepID=A0A517YAP6_9BACT|nr:PSD1 and planctomycete cytochrome C domain-containing protein [Anatilimnocola aggregata]QDU27298.1 Planctomycete cytochrome C [Anatilimnocola aggregata]